MGAVFLGEQDGPLGFRRQVAVKIVDPVLAARNPDLVLALADEAQLLSLLRHPSIVGLQSFESVEDPEFGTVNALVLEYVAGCTLQSILCPDGSARIVPPVEATLHVVAEALAGLAHAHTACNPDGVPMRLVHRDLKPQNIVIGPQGSVRILDFGIAWAVEKLVQTRTRMTKGTLPYMSPEQLAGEPLDGRSDLYALGAIAFEMLAAEPWIVPPSGPHDVLRAARDVALVRFEDRRAPVAAQVSARLGAAAAEALTGWLDRMLAPTPEQRFADASEAAMRLPRPSRDPAGARAWLGAAAAASPAEGPPPLPSTTPMPPRGPAIGDPGRTKTGVTDPEAAIPIDRHLLDQLLDR